MTYCTSLLPQQSVCELEREEVQTLGGKPQFRLFWLKYFQSKYFQSLFNPNGAVTQTGREILFQGFNWESNKDEWWKRLSDKVPDLADSGFTSVWLPPAVQSLSPDGY